MEAQYPITQSFDDGKFKYEALSPFDENGITLTFHNFIPSGFMETQGMNIVNA